MQKRKTICLLVCLALLLMSQALWGQTPVSIKMWASDGSGLTDSVTLAVHPAGTIGIDSVSPTLREAELPPAPQGFEIRVASSAGSDNLGTGSYTSIHHLTRDSQSDVYKLQYQIDPLRTSITFNWPTGLGGVGGGLWMLIPDPTDADAITFPDVDMTTGTPSLTVGVPNSDVHWVYVLKGDGKKFRSFNHDEIGNAMDSKGKKGKGEKRKPYQSEGTFTFTNNIPLDTTCKTDLHIEWSEGIVNFATLSVSPTASSITWLDPPKYTKVDIVFSSCIPVGNSVTIFAIGNKGKPLQAKKYYWTVNTVVTPPKSKFGPVDPTGGRLRLQMPNINNIGEELYAQTAFGTDGITVGVGSAGPASGKDIKGKDFFKGVIHPKWKDATKTLLGKIGVHTAPGRCLNTFDGSLKDILKVQKSLPPDKHNNLLLAEGVAVNVNIGASDYEKTPTGFGDLVYDSVGGGDSPFHGKTVKAIRDSLNNFMQCHPSGVSNDASVWTAVLHRINNAFSGAFDTTSFGNASGILHPKANGTQATGVKAIYNVAYLHRSSLLEEIIAHNYPNIEALEALPKSYELAQNYPNPFNPTTTIEFSLPEDAMVSIVVYNMLGQQVAVLAENEEFTSGLNDVSFDATKLASGVYYYRMIVNDGQFQQVKKMMLLK